MSGKLAKQKDKESLKHEEMETLCKHLTWYLFSCAAGFLTNTTVLEFMFLVLFHFAAMARKSNSHYYSSTLPKRYICWRGGLSTEKEIGKVKLCYISAEKLNLLGRCFPLAQIDVSSIHSRHLGTVLSSASQRKTKSRFLKFPGALLVYH